MDSNTMSALRRQVDDAFVVTGAHTPAWPHPRPDMRPPTEDEYSRCPDPGKYRILAARFDAWVAVLTAAAVAVADEPGDADVLWADDIGSVTVGRSTGLRPVRPDALPIVSALTAIGGMSESGLLLGVADPAVVILQTPDCGCDACDDGSVYLLDQLDETVLHVVSGEQIHVRTPTGTVLTQQSGWSAHGGFGRGEVDQVLADVRAGRSGHTVTRGAAWL